MQTYIKRSTLWRTEMIDLLCKNCGHRLALQYGALAHGLEKGWTVRIWCTQCGRLNTITHNSITIGQKVNFALVKRYKDWEVRNGRQERRR